MVKKLNKNHKLIMRLLFVVLSLFLVLVVLANNFTTKVYADGEPKVYFKDTVVETNESNLIVAEIVAEGVAKSEIDVSYHTKGATAIQGIDYNASSNTVRITIGQDGIGSYKISIKCLNDKNSIENLRVTETKEDPQTKETQEYVYGRYFNILIDKANVVGGASVTIDSTKNVCKCYLAYNYKVSATTGIMNDLNTETAYLNDYEMMQTKTHGGRDDIDGQELWKVWDSGVSFNNDTSKRWTNAFINNGLASAYTTYLIERLDSSNIRSGNAIEVYAGNKEMMKNFSRNRNANGVYLYLETSPNFNELNRLDREAMNIIATGKNPTDKNGDLVDVIGRTTRSESKLINWIQSSGAWYASKNSVVNTTFYKIEPYDGVLDTGIAIFNTNSEFDRRAINLCFLMTLVDDKAPEIVSEYVDDSTYYEDGKLRIYIRFNEPVYACEKNTLTQSILDVRINNGSTPYYAYYVDGNYSDTLVYELEPPKTNISSITYKLPDDIGDMSYKVDTQKYIYNNLISEDLQKDFRNVPFINGEINLSRPKLAIDMEESTAYRNAYDLLASINDGGKTDINSGTLYYSWSKDATLPDSDKPSSYANYHIFTPDEVGSFGVSLTKNNPAVDGNGSYYLHLLAISDYGLKDTKTCGPYNLDYSLPEVTNSLPESDNKLTEKKFVLTYNDKPTNVKLKDLGLAVKYTDSKGTLHQKTLQLIQNGETISNLKNIVIKTDNDGYDTYEYISKIGDVENNDKFIRSIIGDEDRLEIEYFFSVTDTAGNKVISNSIRTVYDKRTLFETTATFPARADNTTDGYEPITDITTSFPAYDISSFTDKNITHVPANKEITIEIKNQADIDLIGNGVKFSVTINNDRVIESETSTIKINDLTPGFYDIVPKISGKTTGENPVEYNLVSSTISFYLTNGLKDETENSKRINDGIVLLNKVYELEDTLYYYLGGQDNPTLMNHKYGAVYDSSVDKYTGGSSSPAFSSSNEAKKYVKYMEYQDMYLVKITANMASLLNDTSGSTIYVKANGETVVAQEGQLWIRYKRNNWTSSSSSYGWVFYYYGNGNLEDGIDIHNLSANLNTALTNVVNTIVSQGKNVYLVTEDTLDQQTGAPYLLESQMHTKAESVDATKNGTPYLLPLTFTGDSSLFNNIVKVGGDSYPLATNMKFDVSHSTELWYKYSGSNEWLKLTTISGARLSQILPDTTGYYTIREYAPSGVSEYSVYIDKETPVLKASIDDQEPMNLDETIIQYTGNKFTIKDLTEIDPYGYVAIYTFPTKNLLNVLYKEDIKDQETGEFELTGGNYYVQVGDRSGNIIWYSVLLATSDLDVKVEENDDMNALIVRVLNRDESEIYSYEVYENEKLLTSEFKPTQYFKAPGIYHIIIEDIYRNRFDKIFEHNLQAPKIEWYYQNSDGGYSKYDEENKHNMNIVKDETRQKTSNVYTSSLLRLVFVSNYSAGEVKFELTGLKYGEYSYQEASGAISIFELKNFTIRVWFNEYPESDYLYIITVDDASPVIDAKFMGSIYKGVVKYDDNGNIIKTGSFDAIDFNKYKENEAITLDTLSYSESNGSRLSFNSGSIISGSRIVLTVNDSSGIKEYKVIRNGQQVSIAITKDNEIKINDYGIYEITVTDMLENTTTFNFVNTNSKLSTAFVDGNQLTSSSEAYGNNNVTVTSAYPSQTTILVKSEDKSATYIMEFDGKNITYGQYFCILNADKTTKTLEYRKNNSFSIDITEDRIKEDRWYTVLSTKEYIIYVKIENKLPVYKVEAIDTKLNIELSAIVSTTVVPGYFVIELSNEMPEIDLLTGGKPVEIRHYTKYIYVSEDLSINKETINPDITKIEVGYSKTPEADKLEVIYENNEFTKDFLGVDEGYYIIVIHNKYGNVKTYTVSKIDSLDFVVYAKYSDGKAVEILSNDRPIYSNSSVEIEIISGEVEFIVNDKDAIGSISGGAATLILDKIGIYRVKAFTSNNIYEEFTVIISANSTFAYNEEWLTGYNENALLKDQGYTNQLLSVDLKSMVRYIEYQYEDNEKVLLYDDLSSYKKTDPELLKDAIGKEGPGKYTVYFRNSAGDVATKEIYYNNEATLKLSRKTTDLYNAYENYDLEFAKEHNFYSNYILRFSTESKNYEFKIDGNLASLEGDKIFEFNNTSGNGSFEYHISFLDEYGNFVEFDAILYRADVIIDTSPMKEILINGNKYTKDNIKLLFADDLEATVVIDGANPIDYESGESYYNDGKYEFTVRDIAGNKNKYTIYRKSSNKYLLTDTTTGQKILMGGVVNNSSVTFQALDDSAIKSVFKNNIKIQDFNSRSFTTTGYWEVLIEDTIGNISYFGFYLINNTLSSFDYEAPFDYEISEVWFTNKNGERELIDTTKDKISLTENGDYAVIIKSKETTSSYNFAVTIDNTLPEAKLKGVEDGGVTTENVTLTGLKTGDIVEIYKDGVLLSTTSVNVSNYPPEIAEGGKYRIVITNLAGAQIEYNFTRKQIANAATSIFVIIACLLVLAVNTTGLIYRTKSKTDV